jgi:hypothetical protein
MAIRHGSIRLSPQDTDIREKFKHTMQRAIERIGKTDVVEPVKEKWDYQDDYVHPWTYKGKNYLRSSTNEIWTDDPGNGASGLGEWCGIYFPGEDCIYSGYEEPEFDATSEEENNTKELILQSEPISMLQVDDILGMDRVEKEDHRRLQAEWKSKEAMLWNKIVDQENTIRAFQKQEKEWQTAAMKHADEIIASHDTDHVEFDMEFELNKMFASWFTYYDPSKVQAVSSSVLTSIKQMIKENTQEISKNESIKLLFYQSYTTQTEGTHYSRNWNTFGYHWLVTTTSIYQLRHFTNGKLQYPYIASQKMNLHYSPSVPQLPYGEFYQWVKLCQTPQGVQWRSLREFAKVSKGSINIGDIKSTTFCAESPDLEGHMTRTTNVFYAMLGVKRCMNLLRCQYQTTDRKPYENKKCMEPCDGEVCLRHMPFATTILSNEHVIEGTNAVVDITTHTVVGWVDESNALQFNTKNLQDRHNQEHFIVDKYNLRSANEEERIQYSKRQK